MSSLTLKGALLPVDRYSPKEPEGCRGHRSRSGTTLKQGCSDVGAPQTPTGMLFALLLRLDLWLLQTV